MVNLRDSAITYPIYPGINDQPEKPTELKGGNGADQVQRYNNLIDAIAPRILLDFSTAETDLGVTPNEYQLLMLTVPYGIYLADPVNTDWTVLGGRQFANFDENQIQEPVNFGGLQSIFTVSLVTGGGYGGGNPLDDMGLEAMEIEGRASFIDLPTVYHFDSGETWNNLVGIFPLEPSLKIKLRPSLGKPTTNQLINASEFMPLS
jgi:hypothetical protein